jgi:hypothetical protein
MSASSCSRARSSGSLPLPDSASAARRALLRPLPARQVGDGEQRPPVVGSAVVELAGHVGVGAAKRGEMIRGPTCRPPPERLEAAWPVEPQALDVFSRSVAAHRYDQAAISQRVGQPADERHRLGRPGREAARLVVVADRAHHVGRVAGVAAIEDAAQLFLVAQEAVKSPRGTASWRQQRWLAHRPAGGSAVHAAARAPRASPRWRPGRRACLLSARTRERLYGVRLFSCLAVDAR